MPTFELAPGQPALFVAPMRGGKSNLIAWLLEPVRSAVIVDSKRHPDEWTAWGPQHGYLVSSDPADIRKHPKVIYQPSMQVLMDVPGFSTPGALGHQWTEALTNVLSRGNTVVVFDELVHVLPAGHAHPVAIQILTQGAAWGISPWGGSQYANRVETMIVRGAVHCFVFQLNPYDLKLMTEKRGAPTEPLAQLPAYGFGYHLTNTPGYTVCAACPLVMGRPGKESSRASQPPEPQGALSENPTS
jgi:hypothetical protein